MREHQRGARISVAEMRASTTLMRASGALQWGRFNGAERSSETPAG